MNTSAYKSYQRGYREQYSDESFKDGIVYTKAPLDTGKARLIVNYTIEDNGESLRVRNGFSPISFVAPFKAQTANSADTILGVTDNVNEDGYKHRLIVVGDTSTIAASASGVVDGSMSIMDVCDLDDFSELDPIFEESSYKDIAAKYGYLLPINSKYYILKDPQVHGLSVPRYCRAVGCFGFNGDYFFFNNSGKLCRTVYNPSVHSYVTSEITPSTKAVSVAMSLGFNMLLPSPYTFSDTISDANTKISFDGIFISDSNGIVPYPFINTQYTVRLYYNSKNESKYKIKYKYKEATAESYADIEEKEYTISSSIPIEMTVSFKSPVENVIIHAEAYKWNGTAYEDEPEAYSDTNVTFLKEQTLSSQSKQLINYDLSHASGMFFWNDRLWLYGVKEGNTILFSSAYNDPSYFPYTNGCYFFHERILKVVPFNDSLLVFTPTKLMQGKYNGTTLTFTTLQANLAFDEYNVELAQTIKTMVFFQSGNYYYMIVPKTLSVTQELVLAPVSTNISYFLDSFYNNAVEVIKTVYDLDDSETLSLIKHYNYLNYEDMHNVYMFRTSLTDKHINFDLIYNTNDRNWKIFLYQSPSDYIPVRHDATNDSELLCLTDVTISGTNQFGITSLYPNVANAGDLYIPNGAVFTKTGSAWDPVGDDIKELFDEDYIYKNYQFLDTGYRNNDLDHNKRFRELQFKFNNTEGVNLKFSTEFVLDGETRIGYYKYSTEIQDGVVVITRTPITNLDLPGTTILAGQDSEELYPNVWHLDVSHFPEIAFWKARLKVSGKGYTPRFRFISKNEHNYEFLGYTWVYRTMYSR